MRRFLLVSSVLAGLLPGTLDAQVNARVSSAAQEEAQVFVSALQAISRLHQGAFADSTLWANALEGLIDSLDDPYAAVFDPAEVEQFEETNTGDYAGIGIQITPLNEVVTVTGVFRGTPADRAGLQVGDIVVGVDSMDARDWTTDEVSDHVRGPVGTDVQVVVERPGYSAPISFPITRATVHIPAVSADQLDDGILYVGMDRVARDAAAELDAVLQANPDVPGVVLDLRQNPGGYLDESLMLADLFLTPGQRLASTKSRAPGETSGYREESWDARVPARLPDVPIVVLVDEFTASAAEILAGALQDYDRALVVGQRTFGKGVVQSVLELPYGRRLRLTTGSWYTPLGRSLHRRRDASGRPLAERVDSLPTIVTDGGRELVAAGGIFPDLEVQDDTLTLRERELLVFAAEQGVPLPLRVAEFAFAQAQELGAAGADPTLRDGAFEGFIEELRQSGVPEDFLGDEEIRSYLAWRTRWRIADRMDRLGVAATVRMERDRVLAEAVALLRASASQSELFAAAGASAGRTSLEEIGSAAERFGSTAGSGARRPD